LFGSVDATPRLRWPALPSAAQAVIACALWWITHGLIQAEERQDDRQHANARHWGSGAKNAWNRLRSRLLGELVLAGFDAPLQAFMAKGFHPAKNPATTRKKFGVISGRR